MLTETEKEKEFRNHENQDFKSIIIKGITFQKLKDHARYNNFDKDDNMKSFDDIIISLIDFYETEMIRNNKIK